MATPFFDGIPVEIMALILSHLDCIPSLFFACRTNRLTWMSFWRYQDHILRSVIINSFGDARAVDAALAVIRFPCPSIKKNPDAERRAVVKRHLEDWALGNLALSPTSNIEETKKLFRLHHMVDKLLLDYAENACLHCKYKDTSHLPSWSHPSHLRRRGQCNHRSLFPKCAVNFNRNYFRRVFILYELAALAFHRRPGGMLFDMTEQHELFLEHLTGEERYGVNGVYDYLASIYMILMDHATKEWEKALSARLPGQFTSSAENLKNIEVLGSVNILTFVQHTAPHLNKDNHDIFARYFASCGIDLVTLFLRAPWNVFHECLRNNTMAMWHFPSLGNFLGRTKRVEIEYQAYNILVGTVTGKARCRHHAPTCACMLNTAGRLAFGKGKETRGSIATVQQISQRFRAKSLSYVGWGIMIGFSWTGDEQDLRLHFPFILPGQLRSLSAWPWAGFTDCSRHVGSCIHHVYGAMPIRGGRSRI